MDFDRSTQARSWIFDECSLSSCRRRAACIEYPPSDQPKVRKFASGFHRRNHPGDDGCTEGIRTSDPCEECGGLALAPEDQELLVQFHAHQIQTLVGPTAILVELCTTETVLSTAISLFRRFYLSNSVVEISPRKMAAACAFFAAKVEEEKIELGLLSHATAVVQLKVQNAPLCRQELRTVSKCEIEEGERMLMEGINYEFRCHHPEGAIRVLAMDFANFQFERKGAKMDERNPDETYCQMGRSPRSSTEDCVLEQADDIIERGCELALRSQVFSDVAFRFAPGNIAFAIVALALGCVKEDYSMGEQLQDYLLSRFPLKSENELSDFSNTVSRIIMALVDCPRMELHAGGCGHAASHVTVRAGELRRVLGAVASIRLQRNRLAQKTKAALMEAPSGGRAKRSRFEMDFTPPRERVNHRKFIKVTPTSECY